MPLASRKDWLRPSPTNTVNRLASWTLRGPGQFDLFFFVLVISTGVYVEWQLPIRLAISTGMANSSGKALTSNMAGTDLKIVQFISLRGLSAGSVART